ncbi:MAG: hypothetical protein AEth_01106 [Candidatus Argoarchaeum ethanivorans]|uniref:HD domain-containing protein n=1 Tax=Candidatus Argoarchaeum ethanivorans TaxID=2608793 RepID=A0A8B3S2B2_9EURY|nr:MAG: hypothetical protein AEth_01106 [Candidatus Argoarchaeum ethanivorans]
MLKLKPNADEALKIAALGHDIERTIEEQKVIRKDYISYDDFKKAHALNSAEILKEIMKACNVKKELIDDVFFLVSSHETGGNRRADVLRDADTISFFHVNLPYYSVRNDAEETKGRCLWGYKKLPDTLKRVVANFRYEDKEIESLLRDCTVEFSSEIAKSLNFTAEHAENAEARSGLKTPRPLRSPR